MTKLMAYACFFVSASQLGSAMEAIDLEDDRWKNRLVLCPKARMKSQVQVLRSDSKLANELKLKVIESKNQKNCQLVGLDGIIKAESESVFTMERLEDFINSMPMRKEELRSQ